MNSTARLLLVDDHQLILDSLQLLCASIPGIEVVGLANDSRRVSELLTELAVDLLVCDLHMPHLSGIDLTLLLRQSHPGVKVFCSPWPKMPSPFARRCGRAAPGTC